MKRAVLRTGTTVLWSMTVCYHQLIVLTGTAKPDWCIFLFKVGHNYTKRGMYKVAKVCSTISKTSKVIKRKQWSSWSCQVIQIARLKSRKWGRMQVTCLLRSLRSVRTKITWCSEAKVRTNPMKLGGENSNRKSRLKMRYWNSFWEYDLKLSTKGVWNGSCLSRKKCKL